MSNVLVAAPVDTATPLSGTGLLESGNQLVAAIESGNWVEGTLAGIGVALDTAATVIDPLGSLIGAGLGWLIDHLEPLKGWFNDFTGDAGEVAGFAQTWTNIQTQLQTAGQDLARMLGDVDELAGEAMDAYRRFQAETAQHLGAAASWAGAMSTGLQIASTIVQVVHDLVRDVLSQLVGSIIAWAAEAVFTLGLATPVIIGQVATKVASWSAKVGRTVIDALSSCRALTGLLDELTALLRQAGSLFDSVLKGGSPPPRHPIGASDSTPGGRSPDDPAPPRGGDDEPDTGGTTPVAPDTRPWPDDLGDSVIDRDLVDQSIVGRVDANTGPNNATFWSGRVLGPDGESIPDAAMNGAADLTGRTHGSTLEQLLERQGLLDDMPDDWMDPATNATWRAVSESLAREASGDVRAFVGDVRPTSVWNEVELPTLVRNPDVTSITMIDARTGEVLNVYQR